MEVTGTLIADLWTAFDAAVPAACVFTEQGMPAWSFDAIISTFDLGKASAQKPAEEVVIITLTPTGTFAIDPAVGDWYTPVTALFFDTGEFSIVGTATKQLHVYAVAPGMPPFEVPDYSDLTFASSDDSYATVSAAGLVTGVAAGDTYISAEITAKSGVNVAVKCIDVAP
jgi:hypothetical protein